MANNKLYITISDKRLGDGQATGSETPSTNTEEEKQSNSIRRYAEHELYHFVKSAAMTTINYSISNIGNMTGDYITQRKVTTAKQMVESGVSIAMTTIAGAKYGSVGAAIGFAVGVGGNAINGYFEDLKNRVENTKTNYNIEQLRNKVGLNTKLDGSRGTEN